MAKKMDVQKNFEDMSPIDIYNLKVSDARIIYHERHPGGLPEGVKGNKGFYIAALIGEKTNAQITQRDSEYKAKLAAKDAEKAQAVSEAEGRKDTHYKGEIDRLVGEAKEKKDKEYQPALAGSRKIAITSYDLQPITDGELDTLVGVDGKIHTFDEENLKFHYIDGGDIKAIFIENPEHAHVLQIGRNKYALNTYGVGRLYTKRPITEIKGKFIKIERQTSSKVAEPDQPVQAAGPVQGGTASAQPAPEPQVAVPVAGAQQAPPAPQAKSFWQTILETVRTVNDWSKRPIGGQQNQGGQNQGS